MSPPAIVAAAGVTRGALYHQFDDKAALFAAVYEEVERDLVADIAEQIMTAQPLDPLEAMRVGAALPGPLCGPRCAADCAHRCPGRPRLGSWREVGEIRAGVIEGMLAHAIAEGAMPDTGPAGDGACAARSARRGGAVVSRATNRDQARTEMEAVCDRLISGIAGR